MKKKIFIILCIIFTFLLIPIPSKMKDGGTVHYNAIIYDIYDVHRITTPLEYNDAIVGNEYIEGIVVKIFGIEVFNNTNPYIEV